MAKIHSESLVITLSKLVKNSDSSDEIINEEIISTIENVIQELVGEMVVVETEKVSE